MKRARAPLRLRTTSGQGRWRCEQAAAIPIRWEFSLKARPISMFEEMKLQVARLNGYAGIVTMMVDRIAR